MWFCRSQETVLLVDTVYCVFVGAMVNQIMTSSFSNDNVVWLVTGGHIFFFHKGYCGLAVLRLFGLPGCYPSAPPESSWSAVLESWFCTFFWSLSMLGYPPNSVPLPRGSGTFLTCCLLLFSLLPPTVLTCRWLSECFVSWTFPECKWSGPHPQWCWFCREPVHIHKKLELDFFFHAKHSCSESSFPLCLEHFY